MQKTIGEYDANHQTVDEIRRVMERISIVFVDYWKAITIKVPYTIKQRRLA